MSAPPKVAAKTTEKKKKKKKKEKINATKGPFGGGDSEEEHEEEGDDQSTTNEASAVQWQSVLIRSLRRGLQAHLLLGSAGNGREVARKGEAAAVAATTTASSTSDTTARGPENAMSVDLETSKVEPRDAQAARYRSATRAGALLLVDGEKEEQEGEEEAQPHDPASLRAPLFVHVHVGSHARDPKHGGGSVRGAGRVRGRSGLLPRRVSLSLVLSRLQRLACVGARV